MAGTNSSAFELETSSDQALGDVHMLKSWGKVQVPKPHYFTASYLSRTRFIGLQAQIEAVTSRGFNKSFLEIGIGPGLFDACMSRLGAQVTTIDFDCDLGPSIVARLPELPFQQGKFDVVCAFEVLEHVPWGIVERTLSEMGRVAKSQVVISVPNLRNLGDRQVSLVVRFGQTKYGKTIYRRKMKRLSNPLEHHWEIGHDGISARDVVNVAQAAGLIHVKDYLVDPYFHFFLFDKHN